MTDTIKPAAWIHAVTNGEDEDYALSFAPDNFPLNGIAGFKSVDVQPLYTRGAIDAAVAQYKADAERYRWLRNECSGEPRAGDHAPSILLFGLQGAAEQVWIDAAVATNHLTDTIDAAIRASKEPL